MINNWKPIEGNEKLAKSGEYVVLCRLEEGVLSVPVVDFWYTDRVMADWESWWEGDDNPPTHFILIPEKLNQPNDDWLPIETAPIGEPVLVCSGLLLYRFGDEWEVEGGVYVAIKYKGNDYFTVHDDVSAQPTHWQQLPEAYKITNGA